MRVIFDLSSIMWTCLLAGKDKEGFNVKDDNGLDFWVNKAEYGYEHAVNSINHTLSAANATPIDAIFVAEGVNSKARRLMIFGEYKKGRGKRPMASYEEFHRLKAMLTDAYRNLGAIFVHQDNVESDDVITWIAQRLEEPAVVRSFDNDLAWLSGKNPKGYQIDTSIGDRFNENPYGLFDSKFITVYKAMVGDSGDNIKGIPGFGMKSWLEFHATFKDDGIAEMYRLGQLGTLEELEPESHQHKLIKKIYEARADYLRSFKLAMLHPEWVDTMKDWPVWKPGMVRNLTKDERLRQWASVELLVTADRFDAFFERFKVRALERPHVVLDIETSTPDESDDWIVTQSGSKDSEKVDTIGSTLTGMSLTFGSNNNYTVYLPVDHKDTNNVSKDQILAVLRWVIDQGLEIVIHSTNFEGTVLYHEFGEALKDAGEMGFLPKWRDSKFEASYVDENDRLGLKHLSNKWLDYAQVDYKTVTTIDDVQYKMNQLPATHVFGYATDDTITTAALHNFFKLHMHLEGVYQNYLDVEIDSSYLHTYAFVQGTRVSLEKLNELMDTEWKERTEACAVVDNYLISKGWDGTTCPVYTEVSYQAVKEAWGIWKQSAPYDTRLRTASKIIAEINDPLFTAACADVESLNRFVQAHFVAKPVINFGSPKQMTKLLYETMGLPIQITNEPTDKMRQEGATEGSPQTGALAITYALLAADEEQTKVLEALKVISLVDTRFKLFYRPLPGFVHWKDGKVHGSHNQCATNTRRASESAPNKQQLSKHEKVEGYSPRVRELYVPHKKNAVMVSFDFKSQEVLLMAEWSGDPGLVGCFVGETKVDMHCMTGVGIYNRKHNAEFSYDTFMQVYADVKHAEYKNVKKSRQLGKTTNFSGQYRVGAKKLSRTLIVTEDDAQAMLEAKAEAFPVAEEWSLTEISGVQLTGKVYTLLGTVRHLRDAVLSPDRYISSKAGRQALSYRIQGSAAEMTKLAEGRMWRERIPFLYDCTYFGPVHDEVVWSVAVEDLPRFIPHVHSLMTKNYAGMKLPIESSVSFGPDFGRQVELDGDYSLENINRVLRQFQLPECANVLQGA